MEVLARWQDGMEFAVEAGNGHKLTVDGPPELGGKDAGARPMELMLASVATCSGIDVLHILNKGGRAYAGLSVLVQGERSAGVPAVFTKIELRFCVPGAERKHAERAVELSVTKYCSALAMLAEAAAISWSLE